MKFTKPTSQFRIATNTTINISQKKSSIAHRRKNAVDHGKGRNRQNNTQDLILLLVEAIVVGNGVIAGIDGTKKT